MQAESGREMIETRNGYAAQRIELGSGVGVDEFCSVGTGKRRFPIGGLASKGSAMRVTMNIGRRSRLQGAHEACD